MRLIPILLLSLSCAHPAPPARTPSPAGSTWGHRAAELAAQSATGALAFSLDALEGSPQPPRCFPGETLVSTPKGDVPINQLGTGDTVWAVDRSSGQQRPARVAFRWDSFGKELITIQAGGETVSSTPSHRFADAETGEWVRAGALSDGQMLVLRDGDQLQSAPAQVRALPPGDVIDVHSLILEGPHRAWFAGGFLVTE